MPTRRPHRVAKRMLQEHIVLSRHFPFVLSGELSHKLVLALYRLDEVLLQFGYGVCESVKALDSFDQIDYEDVQERRKGKKVCHEVAEAGVDKLREIESDSLRVNDNRSLLPMRYLQVTVYPAGKGLVVDKLC